MVLNCLKITQPIVLEIFRNILAWCGVIVQDKSYLSIFQKDSLFGLQAIRVKIMQPYFHDLLCGDYFEMARPIARSKHWWSTYSKNSLLRKWLTPNLRQNYATFGLMICSLRIFLKCYSMKEYSMYTIVTFNFAQKSLLGQMDRLDIIQAKIIQAYI